MKRIDCSNLNLNSLDFFDYVNLSLYLSNAAVLKASDNNIEEILENEIYYKYVKRLYLNNNKISSLEFLKQFKSLKTADLNSNKIESISGTGEMIEYLDLSFNPVKSLKGIKEFKIIKYLNLNKTEIDSVKELFLNCGTLEELYIINDKEIKGFENLNSFKKLKTLRISEKSYKYAKKHINKAVKENRFKLEVI